MTDNTNTKQTTESQASIELYWKTVDQFIEQANQLSREHGMDHVATTLMYAAARFSAFNAASKYTSVDALKLDKDEAIKYFTDTFRKMFKQNMDDYEKNFDQYIANNKQENAE